MGRPRIAKAMARLAAICLAGTKLNRIIVAADEQRLSASRAHERPASIRPV